MLPPQLRRREWPLLLPAGVGEVETTPTERTTSDIAKRARDCGVETTDVGRPIQKGVDDTEERIPDLVGEPPSKRKTAGSRKKVTKGGSSRQIKVGDHVSCASTEFDGSEPGSWSAGQRGPHVRHSHPHFKRRCGDGALGRRQHVLCG